MTEQTMVERVAGIIRLHDGDLLNPVASDAHYTLSAFCAISAMDHIPNETLKTVAKNARWLLRRYSYDEPDEKRDEVFCRAIFQAFIRQVLAEQRAIDPKFEES